MYFWIYKVLQLNYVIQLDLITNNHNIKHTLSHTMHLECINILYCLLKSFGCLLYFSFLFFSLFLLHLNVFYVFTVKLQFFLIFRLMIFQHKSLHQCLISSTNDSPPQNHHLTPIRLTYRGELFLKIHNFLQCDLQYCCIIPYHV